MSKTYYATSEDQEFWHDKDWRDAAQAAINNSHPEELVIGEVIQIYEGTSVVHSVRMYAEGRASGLIDGLRESAAEYAGEASDDWLQGDGIEKKLDFALSAFLTKWCEENDHVPTFGSIENINSIEVEITANDGQDNIEFKRMDGKD